MGNKITQFHTDRGDNYFKRITRFLYKWLWCSRSCGASWGREKQLGRL